ncbi:hypothetical protein GCM10009868_15610 [Terrabacter aerolatus]|uniref:Uncharacterized protein n=1 Tax=Terrabacter aerolatus TaxID=422442 RepID=A0A512D3W9_9MICO|nr:hypothetical protein TAE01_29470 [Terrabacter aerolatus]
MAAPPALSYVGDVSQQTAEFTDAASAMGEDVVRRVLACDSPRTGETVDAGRRPTEAVNSTWVGAGAQGDAAVLPYISIVPARPIPWLLAH